MNRHERFHELLALRLYGELEPREAGVLEGHLADCPDCAAYAEELEGSLGRLAAAADGPPPELEAMPRFGEPKGPLMVRPGQLLSFVAGLAAGLALVLLRPAPTPPADNPLVTYATNAADPFVLPKTGAAPPARGAAPLGHLGGVLSDR